MRALLTMLAILTVGIASAQIPQIQYQARDVGFSRPNTAPYDNITVTIDNTPEVYQVVGPIGTFGDFVRQLDTRERFEQYYFTTTPDVNGSPLASVLFRDREEMTAAARIVAARDDSTLFLRQRLVDGFIYRITNAQDIVVQRAGECSDDPIRVCPVDSPIGISSGRAVVRSRHFSQLSEREFSILIRNNGMPFSVNNRSLIDTVNDALEEGQFITSSGGFFARGLTAGASVTIITDEGDGTILQHNATFEGYRGSNGLIISLPNHKLSSGSTIAVIFN